MVMPVPFALDRNEPAKVTWLAITDVRQSVVEVKLTESNRTAMCPRTQAGWRENLRENSRARGRIAAVARRAAGACEAKEIDRYSSGPSGRATSRARARASAAAPP